MDVKKSSEGRDDARHVEEISDAGDIGHESWKHIKEDATTATEDEHRLTFVKAVRRYPKACFWSFVVTLCIIMDGYDTALLGGLFAFPAFAEKYGYYSEHSKKYTLEAKWQVALGMGSNVGNIFGIAINGYLTDRFGHRRVLMGGLVFLTGFIFIPFFANNVQTLLVGQLLCGLCWGVFTTMAPAFASEVAPVVLRSYFETWVVACWGIGQFISYAVLFTLNTRTGHWAYRIPFAVQWVFPVIIMPFIIFCPESPWWLVRKHRHEDAEKSIMRLTSGESKEKRRQVAKEALALMIETNQIETDMCADTSYLSCFRGTDLRRTEISAISWGIQILTGFVIQGYATYFFNQAGLSSSNSFKMTLGQGGIHLVCNLLSAILTGNYGRRPLFIWGCAVLAAFMILIGGLACGPKTSGLGFAVSAVYLVWFGVWCVTIGPLPYIINGEVSSTRLRAKTIAISRNTYNVLGIVNSVVAPYILNPDQANWGGKTGFLTAGLTIISMIWAYFRLPEMRGRTYEELDILFAEKDLKAKDFSKAVIVRDMDGIRVSRQRLSTHAEPMATGVDVSH